MRVRLPGQQHRRIQHGFSLLELIITLAILSLLFGMAVQVMDYTAKRQRETELKVSLRTIRNALESFKRTAVQEGFSVFETDRWDKNTGYPKKLEYLVEGMKANSAMPGSETKTLYFLREIPLDPMTNSTDWGLRSTEDDPDSESTDGENIYDVYTKSNGTALNGTLYKKW